MALTVVDAADLFLDRLAGVTDPEKKRKIIGHTFIEVFKKEAQGIPGARFLAQGTLYPDVIESLSPVGGPSATIKTHHNVGGLPAELGFDLVEPLRDLFKDEVRLIGEALELPGEMVWRQPFLRSRSGRARLRRGHPANGWRFSARPTLSCWRRVRKAELYRKLGQSLRRAGAG